jgi:hypothetical protein
MFRQALRHGDERNLSARSDGGRRNQPSGIDVASDIVHRHNLLAVVRSNGQMAFPRHILVSTSGDSPPEGQV